MIQQEFYNIIGQVTIVLALITLSMAFLFMFKYEGALEENKIKN